MPSSAWKKTVDESTAEPSPHSSSPAALQNMADTLGVDACVRCALGSTPCGNFAVGVFFCLFFLMIRRPPRSPLFPSTTLFRSASSPPRRSCSWMSRPPALTPGTGPDRKSTRLNSSHLGISYACFCLKKKITHHSTPHSRYLYNRPLLRQQTTRRL